MTRASHGRYIDPLDLVWLRCAEQLGIRVVRSDDTYASWDGRSTLSLAGPADFDPDDSLAQLVLHELCHALVQGPARRAQVDWGLDNTDDAASAVAEHACHRLQAALTDLYGLRELLAVTTTWRSYWDALPADPLSEGDDPAIPLARVAFAEARRGRWAAALHDALQATAALADVVRPLAQASSLWARTRPRNPLGVAVGPADERCGTCAWGTSGRCLQVADPGEEAPEVAASWPACVRWEPRLEATSCRACGACCREGFHAVGVDDDEPLARTHPDWLVRDADGAWLPRPGGPCVALTGGRGAWSCAVYDLRPRACAAFEVAGEHCLVARRRVGLSRA